MIYITGDCHGIHDIAKLSPYNFDDSDMTKEDYLIICGDMGLIWSSEVWADEEDDYRERVLIIYRRTLVTLVVSKTTQTVR